MGNHKTHRNIKETYLVKPFYVYEETWNLIIKHKYYQILTNRNIYSLIDLFYQF